MPNLRPVTTSRERPSTASREAILDAAEQLMAAHGFTGASISRIEKASGLPASSIYWHFGSKDGVLLAMMQRGADRFFAAIPHASEFAGTPFERVEAALAEAARQLDKEPQFLRLLITLGLQHGDDEQVMTLIREVRRRARSRVEEALVAALDALPEEERAAAAAEIAQFGMAVGDGAFVSHQIDEHHDLAATFAKLAKALQVMVEERVAAAG